MNLEPVLGGDDTIRRNFSKVEGLYDTLESVESRLTPVEGSLSVWRTVSEVSGAVGGGAATGTYLPRETGNAITAGTNSTQAARIIPLTAANYAITGKTTELRILTSLQTNATAAGASVTLTLGLLEITASAGAAGGVTLTTAGSFSIMAIVTNPAASSLLLPTSSATAFPTDGHYALAVAVSGAATAANSSLTYTIWLQMRHS